LYALTEVPGNRNKLLGNLSAQSQATSPCHNNCVTDHLTQIFSKPTLKRVFMQFRAQDNKQ